MPDKLVTYSDPSARSTASTPLQPWHRIGNGLKTSLGVGVFMGLGLASTADPLHLPIALLLAALVALIHGITLQHLGCPDPPEPDGSPSPFPSILRYPHDTLSSRYGSLNPWLIFAANWALLLAQATAAAVAAIGSALYLLSGFDQVTPLGVVGVAIASLSLITFWHLQGGKTQSVDRLRLLIPFATLLLGTVIPWVLVPAPDFSPTSQFVNAELSWMDLGRSTSLLVIAYAGSGLAGGLSSAPTAASIRAGRWRLLGTIVLLVCLYLGAALGFDRQPAPFQGNGLLAPLVWVMQAQPLLAQLIGIGGAVSLWMTTSYLLGELADGLRWMGMQRELPRRLIRRNGAGVASWSVMMAAGAIGCLLLIDTVPTLWNVASFMFLVYMAITHHLVVRLSSSLLERILAGIGLCACCVLLVAVGRVTGLVSLGFIILGLIWRGINQWVDQQTNP